MSRKIIMSRTETSTPPIPSVLEEAQLLLAISSSSTATSSPMTVADNENGTATAKNTAAVNQRYVDHTYTDYADVDEDELRLLKDPTTKKTNGGDCCTATKAPRIKRKGSNTMAHFPGKLMTILERGDLACVIDWMPHGRAFVIKQPKAFAAHVLPIFFQQIKFLSFTRQLNLWGFKRITKGMDAGAYYHELFLRGRRDLAMRMRRKEAKGTRGTRPVPNPDREPNFYDDYPWVRGTPQGRVPISLPPLAGERNASVVHRRGDRGSTLLEQGQLDKRPPLVGGQIFLPAKATSAADFGMASRYGNSGGAPTSAVAAGLDLQSSVHSVDSGHFSSASFSSFHGGNQNFNTEDGCYNSAILPMPSKSGVYLPRHATITPASSPTSHPSSDSYAVEDKISIANRRLIERLLHQTAPAPPAVPKSLVQTSVQHLEELARIQRATAQAMVLQQLRQGQPGSMR